MEIKNVSVTRWVGKFNFANPSEEGAQITVSFTIDGERYTISDVVEPGDRYDYDGYDVSDAVDAISNSIERYWISTGREKTRETIKLFRQHEGLIRRSYALMQALRYQKLAAGNAKLARHFLDEAMAEIEAPLEAAAA